MSTQKIGPWKLGETLGEGGFSKVKLGIHETDGRRVAMKMLRQGALSSSARKQVQAEVTALKRIKHKNVINLLDVNWETVYRRKSTSKEVPIILVVLELATGGELFDFLALSGRFEEQLARTYFHHLIDGIGHCHAKGVTHRDLKPENLLLDGDFRLKLADFGFASTQQIMYAECGTPGYMAPEMFDNQGYEGSKVDIWACGVILFIMLAGFPPLQVAKSKDWWFNKLVTNKHALFWQAHSRNAYFSAGMKDLINKILSPNPAARITIEAIRRHPWYNGPTLSDAALRAEMAQRQLRVQQQKNYEKAIKERNAAAATHGALNGAVQRDLGDGETLLLDAATNLPLTIPVMELHRPRQAKAAGHAEAKRTAADEADEAAFFSDDDDDDDDDDTDAKAVAGGTRTCLTFFHTDASPSSMLSVLERAVGQCLGKCSVSSKRQRLTGFFPGERVKLQATVCAQKGDGLGQYRVEFSKRRGASTAFRDVFSTLLACIEADSPGYVIRASTKAGVTATATGRYRAHVPQAGGISVSGSGSGASDGVAAVTSGLATRLTV